MYTFKLAATKTGYDDGPWSTQTASPGKDYDSDDDGLLEITTLAQLNAVRWDLDGNGNASSNQNNYKAAFSSARAGMGCNEDESDINDQICDGYELSANLDFDTGVKGNPNRRRLLQLRRRLESHRRRERGDVHRQVRRQQLRHNQPVHKPNLRQLRPACSDTCTAAAMTTRRTLG